MYYHILLSEPAFGQRSYLKNVLSIEGHTVTTATNAEEAEELFRLIHPDLLITSVMSPRQVGTRAVSNLVKDYQDIPVIFTSDNDMPSLYGLSELAEKPTTAHLLWPIAVDTIVRTVNEVMHVTTQYAHDKPH